MAQVNIMNVVVKDNPCLFKHPFQFEITFECSEDLAEGNFYSASFSAFLCILREDTFVDLHVFILILILGLVDFRFSGFFGLVYWMYHLKVPLSPNSTSIRISTQ